VFALRSLFLQIVVVFIESNTKIAQKMKLPNTFVIKPEYWKVTGKNCCVLTVVNGRAVAEAVSRWLPTAAARVRVRAACGVCGGQSSIGSGFLRVLRFPLPIISPLSPSL
jgi:hypothetical protein